MKSVLKYPGAKNRIASWICSYIPDHKVYLEPYAGSLAVLFYKERCHIETVNDIDTEIVNFYKVLTDSPGRVKKNSIKSTRYARSRIQRSI